VLLATYNMPTKLSKHYQHLKISACGPLAGSKGSNPVMLSIYKNKQHKILCCTEYWL